jgi:hypothetical protein
MQKLGLARANGKPHARTHTSHPSTHSTDRAPPTPSASDHNAAGRRTPRDRRRRLLLHPSDRSFFHARKQTSTPARLAARDTHALRSHAGPLTKGGGERKANRGRKREQNPRRTSPPRHDGADEPHRGPLAVLPLLHGLSQGEPRRLRVGGGRIPIGGACARAPQKQSNLRPAPSRRRCPLTPSPASPRPSQHTQQQQQCIEDNGDNPPACKAWADDYLECLHHRRYHERKLEVAQEKRRQEQAAASGGGHGHGGH